MALPPTLSLALSVVVGAPNVFEDVRVGGIFVAVPPPPPPPSPSAPPGIEPVEEALAQEEREGEWEGELVSLGTE